SSLQLSIQTGFNALLAAFIAPFFWDTPLLLASGAALAMLLSLVGVALAWSQARRAGAVALTGRAG
ncbi:Bcr/CflA family drug resistance efflux transporter, partial [Pseudomonas aeruginosa]